MNRGRFAHEVSLIYTNWRLFGNGKEFLDCRGQYTRYICIGNWKWNNGKKPLGKRGLWRQNLNGTDEKRGKVISPFDHKKTAVS